VIMRAESRAPVAAQIFDGGRDAEDLRCLLSPKRPSAYAVVAVTETCACRRTRACASRARHLQLTWARVSLLASNPLRFIAGAARAHPDAPGGSAELKLDYLRSHCVKPIRFHPRARPRSRSCRNSRDAQTAAPAVKFTAARSAEDRAAITPIVPTIPTSRQSHPERPWHTLPRSGPQIDAALPSKGAGLTSKRTSRRRRLPAATRSPEASRQPARTRATWS